jgi:putative intracellular protease/amidase
MRNGARFIHEIPRAAAAPDLLSGMHVLFPVPLRGGMDHEILFPIEALRAHGASERWLGKPHSLAALERELGAEGIAAGFDAIVVPGGQGKGLYDFLTDPLLHRVLAAATRAQKIVALQCHSVVAGTLARDAAGRTLLDGRVTAESVKLRVSATSVPPWFIWFSRR